MLLKLSLVTLIVATVVAAREEVTVQTKFGNITGYKNEFGGYSFLGVPFAAMPVGELRFRPPQDPAPWTLPLNATQFGPGCPAKCNGQKRLAKLMCPLTTSEACLFLNIYTPALGADKKLPIFHFTHGGMDAWGSGSIPLYSGSKWSKDQNIIIITINYRENLFGGLMTSNVVGNFMIRDQIQSLKFVQAVIPAFGGDPGKVTISGQSSGAAMTGTLYTSPKAYPYFSQAAIISDPIGFIPATQKMARELGDVCLLKLGCKLGQNASEEFRCLQSKTTEEILKASTTSYLPTSNEVLSVLLPWQPSVDHEYVFDSPITQIEKGQFAKKPLYIGTVANETIPFVMGIEHLDVQNWLLDLALDYILGGVDGKEVEKLYGPIPKTPAMNTSKGGMPFFSEILTDYTFFCPTHYIADLISQHNVSTHVYFFDHIPSWAEWYEGGKPGPCTEYVCHAFDLPTVFDTYFKLPKGFPDPTAGERKLSTFVQTAIAQFLHTGTITGDGWPQYNNVTRTMYNLTVPVPSQPISNYRRRYCDLWDKIGYNRR